MLTVGFPVAEDVLAELEEAWRTSDALFELVDEAWLHRPIPLRHPFLFYLGHLPAFAWNQLGKGVLERPPIDAGLEELFERGIDPSVEGGEGETGEQRWPAVGRVLAFRDRVRDAVREAYPELDACQDDLLCRRNRVAYLVLEHELMHHETLMYMLEELEHERKHPPAEVVPVTGESAPVAEAVGIPGGRVTLGADFDELEFGWDNEFPRCERRVESFALDRLPVTVEAFLEFVEAGGYEDEDLWTREGRAWRERTGARHPHRWFRRDGRWMRRAHFEDLPLERVRPWPVLVTQFEAEAYARWRGARLPTEAELHRAAYGTREGGERPYPWGEEPPAEEHGNFGLQRFDPVPVGRSPAGRSAFGVEELVGNAWEWTASTFGPFPGFEAYLRNYPGYSADFFGGRHNVVFGGGPATHPRLLRRSFRNWFQRGYPHVNATFRCASG